MSDELTVSGDQQLAAAVPPQAEAMDSQPEQERQVPLAALESERSKRQQMEEENRMMREHLLLMQAQSSPKQEKPQKSYDRGDVPTWGEVEDFVSEREKQFKTSYEELRMAQKYPDYQSVITQYLPEVLKQNPKLRGTLEQTQDFELAYYLAKNSDGYKSSTAKTQRSEEADRIIRNSSQAGSLSSMGSSTPVMQSKRYKDMSDKEFRDLMHRNLGY